MGGVSGVGATVVGSGEVVGYLFMMKCMCVHVCVPTCPYLLLVHAPVCSVGIYITYMLCDCSLHPPLFPASSLLYPCAVPSCHAPTDPAHCRIAVSWS